MKSTTQNTGRMVIRKMTIKDYDEVITLWKQGDIPCRPQGRDSRKNIEWQLKQPTSLYFIAEMNHTIIGVILGTHDGRKGWINRLVVAPSQRHRGVAKLLVREVESRLAADGIDIVACLVEDWNETSQRVFKRLGYTKHDDILYFSKRKTLKV